MNNPHSLSDIKAMWRELQDDNMHTQRGWDITQWFRANAMTIIATLLKEDHQ